MAQLSRIGALALCLLVVVACSRATAIRSGVPQVHVRVTASHVIIDPGRVPAGEIYVVLVPPTESVPFVQRLGAADGTPGPLDEAQLIRIASGDMEGTSLGAFSVGECDSERRSADRGLTKVPGRCGNAFPVSLVPGRYAFLGPHWVEQTTERQTGTVAWPAGPVSDRLAILEVVP
jgi:hypothetical protein